MLQSIFLLFFHAFLRIGEITVHSKALHESVTQVTDVTISNSSLTLVMCHFKHNTSGHAITLSISRTHDKYCQVLALSHFKVHYIHLLMLPWFCKKLLVPFSR